MKFFISFCLLILFSFDVSAAAKSAGMEAFNEADYSASARLLSEEIKSLPPGSAEYFEYTFALIDSLLRCTRPAEAKIQMDKIRKSVPSALNYRFDLFEAQLAFINNDLKKCEKILNNLEKNSALNARSRYDMILMLSDIYLKSNRTDKAIKLLAEAIKDKDISSVNKSDLKLLELHALAAGSKNALFSEKIKAFKTEFPDRKDDLKYFELLNTAINGNFKEYDALFKKIFPDKTSRNAATGDPIVFRAAEIISGKSAKAPGCPGLASYLQEKIFFAPTDSLRGSAYRELIDLLLKNKAESAALSTIKNMLSEIPSLSDRSKWELLMADLQYSLKVDDHGLAIYIRIKNSSAAPSVRAKAAVNAADIYQKQGNKNEMLKLYAFLSEFPNNAEINDSGVLLTGKYYFENHEYRMGESLLNRIPPESKIYHEALFYLIQCKICNGELESAAKDIITLSNLKEPATCSLPEIQLSTIYFTAIIAELHNKQTEAAELFEKVARQGSKRRSALPMLTNSMLKAAELRFKLQSYSNAGLLFLTFAEQYPKHEKAPMALYKSVYSYFLAGRFDEMKYSVSKLRQNFPDNELTINALFHENDYYRENDRMQDALKTLDIIAELNKKRNDPNIISQILYDRAMIYHQLQRLDEAISCLKDLKKYKNKQLMAEGAFLSGTIAAEQNNLKQSAEYYLEAASLNSTDILFSAVCRGRAADNFFIIGSKNNDQQTLKQAVSVYSDLVKTEKLPIALSLQSFYKLGRTLENLNDFQGALDAYTEALYIPGLDKINNPTVPIWVNKSALNAINIYLRMGGRDTLNDALYIVRRLKKLNSMSDKELENLEYNVRERYANND